MAANKGQMNSDEAAGSSSGHNQNWKHSSRKRANPASTAPKEPLIKIRKYSTAASSTKKSIDHLPSEILESILQNVSTPDLINCRQLNRRFNEIASGIMRKSADIELCFSFLNGKFMQKFQRRHCEELLVDICYSYLVFGSKSLTDLIECLKESNHFPITSFRFDDLDKFGNEDMRSFLLIWEKNILGLNIHINDPMNTIGILRDLLVEKAPNLKTLELRFNWAQFPSSIKLFADSSEFQLPKLQTLRVNRGYRQFRGIIADILKAACNLNDFSYSVEKKYRMQHECPCVVEGINTDDLAMLQTFNKIHCLKDLRIDLSEDLILFWSSSPKMIDLKLKSLAISFQRSIWKNNHLISSTTTILNQLFHSSKDAIQTLRIQPLGSLPGLNIPKFENLQKLELFDYLSELNVIFMFPALFDMTDNFPKLKNLGVYFNWHTAIAFPESQPIKPMLNIEVLRIIGYVPADFQDNLMKATPNAKTLLIEDWSEGPISINFRTIANYLPKLESFGWLISRGTHHELMHSLDAAITGLPEEFCQQNAKKFRKRVRLSAKDRAFHQLQQRNSSILDLKELKRMDVNFLMDGDAYQFMDFEDECDCDSHCDDECEKYVEKDDEAGFSPDSIFYKSGFTKNGVSHRFDSINFQIFIAGGIRAVQFSPVVKYILGMVRQRTRRLK